jgi:hypothetical protein
MTEPMPPDVSTLVDRLYHRLPGIYRQLDAGQDWLLKRYLNCVLGAAGDIDDLVEAFRGSRAVGPATPEPWALSPDEMTLYRDARTSRLSSLGDPFAADAAWLPWLAQLVGVRLDPAASETEQRDTIAYATSGYKAGTKRAMEDAARSALIGSRYARCVPQYRPDGVTPGPWDVTIITRGSETPDPLAVVGAILRKGVKPAGVVLWTQSTQATWDTLEASRPTWADWEASPTWTALEETGLTYADVPDNLAPNASFETGISPWVGLNASTTASVTGGPDGAKIARVTSTTTASHTGLVSPVITGILADRDYLVGVSVNPQAALASAALLVTWQNSSGGTISTTSSAMTASAGVWTRGTATHHAPVGAAKAVVTLDGGVVTVANHVDFDAVLFRLV